VKFLSSPAFANEFGAHYGWAPVRSDVNTSKGDPQVDSADRMQLRISLPPLAPGRYRVSWRVLSVDTHVATGQFTFDIAP